MGIFLRVWYTQGVQGVYIPQGVVYPGCTGRIPTSGCGIPRVYMEACTSGCGIPRVYIGCMYLRVWYTQARKEGITVVYASQARKKEGITVVYAFQAPRKEE